jgi:hypothetical protein
VIGVDDKLKPGLGLTEADPGTVEIVEREMAALADDLALAIQAAGGPLSDVSADPEKLEERIDAVVLRLAECVCARPRAVLWNRCAIFVAVTGDARGRVGLVPALVRADKLHIGFHSLLQAAEKHGRILATLTVLTEPSAAEGVRVSMAGRHDHRGMLQKWSRGVLQADGTAKLRFWSAERPPGFFGWAGEEASVPKPKDLLN